MGKPFWVRSKVWILLFSPKQSTSALSGGSTKVRQCPPVNHELRIATQLEGLDSMQLEIVLPPNTADGRLA
jgi:hypothetical protein